MADKSERKYGLILKKKPTSVQLRPSVFGGDDSGDDEESGRKTVNVTIRKEAEKNKQLRQTQLEINKVLEDDPTAYDYDAVYDKMAERKANLLAAKTATANRKPKYISNLLKFAEVRKKEDERRVERQVQKERETEGNEFADKDAFVTSAYRQKMQEMAEEEERQRKRDERDGDVTKQADLSMFYRNLLDRNVSTGGSFNTEGDKDNQYRQSSIAEQNERKTEQAEQSSDDEKKRRRNPDCGGEGNSHPDDRKAENEYGNRKTKSKKEPVSEKNKQFRDDKETREKSREHEKGEHRHDEQELKHEQQIREREQHKNAQEKNAKPENEESEKHKTELCRKLLNDETDSKTERDKDFENMESKHGCLENKNEEKKSGMNKFAKHTSSDTVMSARERYLARKKTRVVVVQTGSDDED